MTAQQSIFNVHLCVDGDGLLSYFDRRVHVLWLQSLPYLSGLLCCFTNDVSISLIRQFILVLELCKVLAMPDHRPHAPYVGVPKWERRSVLLWRLFMNINQQKLHRNYLGTMMFLQPKITIL